MNNITYGHNSHYTVNGVKFNNKTLALMEANRLQLDVSQVQWNFHDQELNSVNWTHEPDLSMNQLYAMRARQIREKYDYVIVMCSGGADANNIIYSFLENGIHIDEIIASAPLSGLRDWQDNSNNESAENTISETRLAQIPFLNEVEQKYPRVKITLNDYFEDILKYQDTDWLIRSTDYVHPSAVARYDIEKFPHLRALAETEKRIAVVYGIDKPNINIKGNKVYNSITDWGVNVPGDFVYFKNFHVELFYYSHTLPEIMIKQSHELLRWLQLPENKHALDLAKLNNDKPAPYKFFNHGPYQRAIVPCIYPHIERPIWQAQKHSSNILANHDNWFYKHHSSLRAYDMITSNINDTLNKLHPQYFQYQQYYENGKLKKYRKGLKLFLKQFYIGELNEIDRAQ
jgi:hypothetical protein